MFRATLARKGVSRKQLVRLLAQIDVKVTEAAIANRVHRGTISLAFLLQVAAALGLERIELGGNAEPPGQAAGDSNG